MSIPKILHSSFFGNWKFSDLNKRCFASWEDKLPGWERMDWRWDNLPEELRNHHWVKAARNCQGRGAGSNAGAYIKFWLMHKYGGYYIDNDVEVLKEFPLDHAMVLAWQRDDMCPNDMSVNASVAGCEPGNWFCQEYLRRVEARPPCDFPLAFGPMLYTKILRERGLTGMNVEQKVDDVMVFEKSAFYPWRWDESPKPENVIESTIAIHHWEGSWKD